MKLGCQTITFGENQREQFDDVFRVVADAGYAGVEIGYRRIAGYDFGELRELMAKHSLTFLASHIGGNLEDESQAAGERSLLDEILTDLQKLGVGVLMYSGLSYKTESQFERDFAMVKRSAAIAADHGVKLLYHNHNWEFLQNARVYRALIDDGGDALGFCPDVGWIFKGGAPILSILESIRDRIGVIHLKDFASRGTDTVPEVCDTVEFGNGLVPLREVAQWVSENTPEVWVVAEQDRTSISPGDAVTQNGKYVSSLFSSEET